MAKDPAFLFYTNDFERGCQFFSDEQVGKYLRLLMAQHQHGHLTEQQMNFICKSYDKQVFEKFTQDADGKYYQKRLEDEIFKRKAYTDSRSKNKQGKGKTKKKPKKIISKSYDSHMENENENEIIIDNVNELEKRKVDFANKISSFGIGISKETLKAFFEYWTEHNEGGKKMRFEMQPVFDIAKRLTTWVNRNKKFNVKNNGEFTEEDVRRAIANAGKI